MLEAIANAQRRFIIDADPRGSFEELLAVLLRITESEYGFIAEILHDSDGEPYLKAHAITNIAWDESTRAFYEKFAATGLEFHNMQTLFGAVVKSGQAVISNNPASDPRRGGLPQGHPALRTFLGLPFMNGTQLVGMVGVANRAGGYSPEQASALEPLLATCSTLILGHREYRRRREAEAALAASERRLNAILSGMPDLVFVLDEGGRYAEVLGGPAHLMYAPAAKVRGKTLHDILPEDLATKALGAVQRVLSGGGVEVMEYSLKVPAGEVWFEGRVTALKNGGNKPTQAVFVSRDVSERKRAEQALRDSSERFRGILESTLLGVAFWTADGTIIDANSLLLQLTGWTKDDVQHRRISWQTLTPPDRNDTLMRCMADLANGGTSAAFETEVFHRTGRRVPVLIAASRLSVPGSPNVAFVADITERKSLEEQLRQSQKMEAIGRLAGGVAHDFNNLLVVITGYADILAASLKEDSLKSKVEQIGIAAQRASDLTRQLLAYSRRQVLQPRIISLSRTVEAMHRMLERLLSEDIQLVKILSAAGSVRADPGQLEQVLMNLAINARDAMPRGGTLTIETLDVELDDTYMRRHGEVGQPGPYVMLAISDTGVGMPRDVLERVFEPFFTTKEKGKGTGLGLSMVYGIVKQSGGNVFVYSEPGKGTTFKVYLPRVKANNATESDTMPSTPEGARGETILVVEDEDAVRALVCEVLQSAGYRTLDANGGEDAATISDGHDGDIHMLVTDVVMPKMNGVAVARALTQKRPGMKVLYMSGYTENAVVHHGVLDPGIRYLQKPFMPAELIRKVRGILDNK